MAKNKPEEINEPPEMAAEVVEEQPEMGAEEDDGLIPVTKDGQTIRVCAAQVDQHQRLGWQLAE